MVKYFFYLNANSVWIYGELDEGEVTHKIEYIAPAGQYRRRKQTVNEVELLSIVNANNPGVLIPFNFVPITEVAKNAEGDAYATIDEFDLATKDFFFRVGGSGVVSGDSLGKVVFEGDDITTQFQMPDNADLSGVFFVNGSEFSATLSLVSGVKTITFSIAPTSEQFPEVIYTKTVSSVTEPNFTQYSALLTQSGTNAPAATVLLSTIGTNTVWTFSAVGTYIATNIGKFTVGKASPVKAVSYTRDDFKKLVLTPIDVDSYKLETFDETDTLANGILSDDEVNIFIYK